MPAAMGAYRCSTCAINWPVMPDYRFNQGHPALAPEYSVCAQCGEPCDLIGDAYALDRDTARLLKLQFEFERFCERRDQPLISEAA